LIGLLARAVVVRGEKLHYMWSCQLSSSEKARGLQSVGRAHPGSAIPGLGSSLRFKMLAPWDARVARIGAEALLGPAADDSPLGSAAKRHQADFLAVER
jgi:hypothetical protein